MHEALQLSLCSKKGIVVLQEVFTENIQRIDDLLMAKHGMDDTAFVSVLVGMALCCSRTNSLEGEGRGNSCHQP